MVESHAKTENRYAQRENLPKAGTFVYLFNFIYLLRKEGRLVVGAVQARGRNVKTFAGDWDKDNETLFLFFFFFANETLFQAKCFDYFGDWIGQSDDTWQEESSSELKPATFIYEYRPVLSYT